MKRNLKSLAALLLVCVLVIATPAGLRSARGAIDPDTACTLTVQPAGPDSEYTDLLAAEDAVVDVYQVAAAIPAEGSDAYAYEALPAFAELEDLTTDADTEGWNVLAQEVFAVVLRDHLAPDVTVPVKLAGDLPAAGLYLVIARNDGNLDTDAYVTAVTDDSGEESLATVIKTGEHTYRFAPALVCVPTKEADEDGVVNAAGPGEWDYNPTITLKPERVDLLGSIEIVKTLDRYMMGRPATFIFEVTATLNDEVVYNNVVSITLAGASTDSVKIVDKIPVGATVTVKEVYSGITNVYKQVSEDPEPIVLQPEHTEEDPAVFAFENDVDNPDNPNGGGSITNHFVYHEEADWEWTPLPDKD